MPSGKSPDEIVSKVWSEYTLDREAGKNVGLYWWDAGPELHHYINRMISGDPDTYWVPYALERHFANRIPLGRCLSLGCGSGPLERDLFHRGTFDHCDAYDAAEVSIQRAQELAQAEGIANITYRIADVNTLILPSNTYDAVFIAGAMHHFEALEHVCQQIKNSLKPDGLLIMSEYIGPSHFQFPPRQKEVMNLCLRLLPPRYRIPAGSIQPEPLQSGPVQQTEKEETSSCPPPIQRDAKWYLRRLIEKARDGDLLPTVYRKLRAYSTAGHIRKAALMPPGKMKNIFPATTFERTEIEFPVLHDVIASDPSEAVRSVEIMEVLQRDFEIIDKRDWGGTIFQFLLPGIAGRFAVEDEEARSLLRMVLNIEETLIRCGELKSDLAVIVARPLR